MDSHAVLGVSVGASETDIRNAYQELALRYHPDMREGNEEMFCAVQEAYAALSGGGAGGAGGAGAIPVRRTVPPGTREHKVITLQTPGGRTMREQVWIRYAADGRCNMFTSPCAQ